MAQNDADAQATAMAALSLCEALLIALVEHKVIPGLEARGILQDAAAAHQEAADDEASDRSRAAAAIIRAMLVRNVSAWALSKG